MSEALRILHLEDSPDDSELVQRALAAEGIRCKITRVETKAEFLTELERGEFDLILADYTLPGFDGMTALLLTRKKRSEVPFILISGTVGEETAVEALKAGATDYIMKERTSRLPFAVRRALEEARERQAGKLTEELLAGQARLSAFSAEIGLALTKDKELRRILQSCCEAFVTHLNAAFARIWTLSSGENVLELQASAGMYTHIDGPHRRVPLGKFQIGLIAEERKPYVTNHAIGDPRTGIQAWAEKEGIVSFAGYPLIFGEQLVGVMAMFARVQLDDLTLRTMESMANHIALGIHRKQSEIAQSELQKQLAQAQKIEAIGQLAGGIAHDYNNTLMVIGGYSELLLMKIPENDPLRKLVLEIQKGVTHGADLTRQLLAFSRRQLLQPKVVDLNQLIAKIQDMMRRLIGEDIQLYFSFAKDLGVVKADPGQVHQLILNLALNA